MGKIKLKLKFTALALISIIILSSFTPILSETLYNEISKESGISPVATEEYLYLNEVTDTDYYFFPKGACYAIVDIVGIDITHFKIDNQIYDVSYGINIIPIEFSNQIKLHTINIEQVNLQYFKSLTVEPLFLAEDEIMVTLDQNTEINFKAAGPISILTRINFLYNWLYVELQNKGSESTILKNIQDTAEYPEVDPLFYCLFVERGTYIRYDINLGPGEYNLLLQGNGSLEYIIMINSDWDEDEISDVDEIQQKDVYNFDLEPTNPDIWGFFEKANENLFASQIQEDDGTNGFFSFFIPENSFTVHSLSMKVKSGEFKEIIVDGNAKTFENETFVSNSDSPPVFISFGTIEAGWHHISYIHKANYTSEIEFLINNLPIKVLKFSELRDTDGDGVKDLAEFSNSLNPYKIDTDDDGIPDSYDASPLAKLELNPKNINQIVVPTDENRDTIVNIQIEKPANDYSTYGSPRLWRDELNVSIYPVLRMFGNKYVTEGNRKYNMNRGKLGSLWGKPVLSLFKSDEIYDDGGIGDSLPNPSELDSEFYFIFPKPSTENFDYSIMIPQGHGSKSDGFLDLRFDFIWLVTHYDRMEQSTSLLHFYDFEDNILVRSMGMREVSNVEYILGSPDCFIDNQILWNLAQNPSLGTSEEFGVEDDIIGQGNVEYFSLPEITVEDRENNLIGVDESEVLYMAGSYRNYDILNKIQLQTQLIPDFAALHQGDFEVYFSSYTVTNLYEDQNYSLDASEIQGERKTLYQTFQFNDVEQRANILGLPISMELCANSKGLKISQAQGFNIPLSEIPSSNLELNPEIFILHQTYIERNTQNPGIPLVNFEDGVDIYKEYVDNRQEEVVLSDLFFYDTSQIQTPAEKFQNIIENYWDQYDSFNKTLYLLHNNITAIAQQVPVENLEESFNSIIDKIDVFRLHSYTEVNYYPEFFQIIQNLEEDMSNLMDMINTIEFEYSGLATTLVTLFTQFGEEIATFSESFYELLAKDVNDNAVNADPKQTVKNSNTNQGSFKWKTLGIRITLGVTGGVCIFLGSVMTYYAIVEIFTLSKETDETDYSIRMMKALAMAVAGAVLTIEGILLVASAIRSVWATSLSSTIKFLGYAGAALAIFIYVIDLSLFIEKLVSKDYDSLSGEIFNFVLSTTGLVSCLLLVFGGAAATGVGVVLGVAVAAVLIFMAIWEKKMNDPSFILEDSTGPYFSPETEANVRRHGGLEIGDSVNFALDIDNDGDNPLWIRARFRVVGEFKGDYWGQDNDGNQYRKKVYEWEGDWDIYKGPWSEAELDWWIGPSGRYREDFTSQIKEPSLDLNYELEIEVDWEQSKPGRWIRKDLAYQIIVASLNMPVVENTIAYFYGNTTDYGYESLLYKVNSSLEEYRYKDAFNVVNDIISGIEWEISKQNQDEPGVYGYERIPLEWYFLLEDRVVDSGGPNYQLRVDDWSWPGGSDIGVWCSFIRNFYDSGFRADVTYNPKDLFPTWTTVIREDIDPHWFRIWANPDFLMYIPKTWVEDLEPHLVLGRKLIQLRNSLLLRTNIETDLNKTVFEDDPISGIVNISLKLLLDGPDYSKQVKFEITPPEGFSISPKNNFTGRLDSTIYFTLIRDTPVIDIKGYHYGLKIYLGSDLIYQDSVPFKFSGFSRVELENHTAIEPIVPGEIFNAVIINNTGTYPEILNVSVSGTIQESFVYKGYYPNNFTGNTLTFMFYPRESRIGLAINPPRHYTTKPGIYDYTIHVLDIYGTHDIIFSDTFEVGEFYDINFELLSIAPRDTIFDYQEAIYTYNLTNLGNVNQTFQISYDNIMFASEALNTNSILLEPGEWQLVSLTLVPTGWGNQAFNINATSKYNSSMIKLNITILDDDINPPEFTNFEIIDAPLDITINFEVWNEVDGEDYGLSEIKIYIDNELILVNNPDYSETIFSFIINTSHGEWFIQYGPHEIRVEITDADNDVPNDTLANTAFGTFEVTPDEMMTYISWELSELEDYVNSILSFCYNRPLINSIGRAQCKVQKALDYYNSGCETKSIFLNELAKASLELSNLHTYLLVLHSKITEENACYIFTESHEIRDHITLTMGAIVGTKDSLELAIIIVDMSRFVDNIWSEYDFCIALSINCRIGWAIGELDKTLLLMSIDSFNKSCVFSHISQAICKLECTITKVSSYLNHGWITEEQAGNLIEEIDIFIDRLNNLITGPM